MRAKGSALAWVLIIMLILGIAWYLGWINFQLPSSITRPTETTTEREKVSLELPIE